MRAGEREGGHMLGSISCRDDAGAVAGATQQPLLVVAGKLVSDNTPEARDSAKSLISILRGAFEVSASTPDHEVAAGAHLSVTASFLASCRVEHDCTEICSLDLTLLTCN